MDDKMIAVIVGIVFVTVFLASEILVISAMGTRQIDRKKLKKRSMDILQAHGDEGLSIVKQHYFDRLGGIEKWFESLFFIAEFKKILEQAGKKQIAYRVALIIALIMVGAGLITWVYTRHLWWVLGSVLVVFVIPLWWLRKQRMSRLDKFEEQLPDALQMMSRSMSIGYSFLESMTVVSKEMSPPISLEFAKTVEEIKYGRDIEVAFILMIERVPSLSLIAMTTAINIQKETGGNLSEVFLKISHVLNNRFKLHRRIKTLSADGTKSAWVLIFLPFALFAILKMLNPGYFDPLFKSTDREMVLAIFLALEIVAMLWIRLIINIDA